MTSRGGDAYSEARNPQAPLFLNISKTCGKAIARASAMSGLSITFAAMFVGVAISAASAAMSPTRIDPPAIAESALLPRNAVQAEHPRRYAPHVILDDLAVIEVLFGITRESADGEPKFLETRVVPYTPGQRYGWTMSVRTGRERVRVREELTMPAPPASWGRTATDPRATLSKDRRRAVVEEETTLDRMGRSWIIDRGDPRGLYKLRLYVEDVLVGEATFVVGIRSSGKRWKDTNLPP